MKKSTLLLTILIIFSSIFYHYSLYERQFSVKIMLIPLSVLSGFIFLMLILLKLTKRNFKKLIVLFSSFLVLFFSYGYFYEFLKGYRVGEIYIFRHRTLLLIWIIIFILLLFLIKRNHLKPLINIYYIISCILILSALINIYNNINFKQGLKYFSQTKGNNQGVVKDYEILSRSQPDIYYIILDSYANPRILKDIYNFNNQDFLDYLGQKGFYIARQSRSNYSFTLPSLASALNMDYLHNLDKGIKEKILYNKIINNKVKQNLKKKGYEYINLSEFRDKKDDFAHPDLLFRYKMMDEFILSLIKTTIFRPLYDYFINKDILAEKTLWIFRELDEISSLSLEKPKFVFAHILPPHPPFVFDKDNKNIRRETTSAREMYYKEKYINQLIFINKQLEKFINQVLSKHNGLSPIIILQADHGPASTFPADTSAWSELPSKEMLSERMYIFNAYYLPQNYQEDLYDSISPVNSFRLIFNKSFNTHYEFLSDESYYSTDRLNHFINVTNILDSYNDRSSD